MATFLKLKTIVDKIIQDDDLVENISTYLNQGVTEIAGGMLSAFGDRITPALPELFTIATVDTVTDAAYVAMPSIFQRDLQFVAKSDGVEVDIANSFIEFSECYPLLDHSGPVVEVIEKGGQLYYQGIPTSADTLTLHFYRFPVEMTANSDVPDGIPEHLHIPLLVNYAAWKCYEKIEDGLEGDVVNTTKYMQLFMAALKTLEISISHEIRGFNLIHD